MLIRGIFSEKVKQNFILKGFDHFKEALKRKIEIKQTTSEGGSQGERGSKKKPTVCLLPRVKIVKSRKNNEESIKKNKNIH